MKKIQLCPQRSRALLAASVGFGKAPGSVLWVGLILIAVIGAACGDGPGGGGSHQALRSDAGSAEGEGAPPSQELQSDASGTLRGDGESDLVASGASNPLLSGGLSSADSGSELNEKQVGRGLVPASGKATFRPRPSGPSAKGPRAKSRRSRSSVAEHRSQRRARRRQNAKRFFAAAAIVAVAAAASANSSAGTSGGSSSGASSSAGGSGDDDVPAHMKLGLPDPDSDVRGYDFVGAGVSYDEY